MSIALASAADGTAKTLTDLVYGWRWASYGSLRRISEAAAVDPHEIGAFVATLERRGMRREPDDADK